MISKEDSGSNIDLEEIQETSSRVSKPPQFYYSFHIEEDKISNSTLSELDEPANYKEAMASPKPAKWKEAMKSEIQYYPKRVCKLQKAIYGLKHASRSWNLYFHEKVTQFGFSRSEDESCIYVKVSGSVVVFVVLYVDDILLIGNDIPTLQSVKDWLGKCFAMKYLGDATYILGIKIYRDRSKRLIGLSQDTYLDKILKRFKMENSKKGNLPLHHGIKISKDLCPKTDEELDQMSRVPYALAIGSIMYVMTYTRPDVSFCFEHGRFLVYGGEELRVTGYSDASWQIDKDDSRSQSGWVFLLNGSYLDEAICDNKSVVALTKEPNDHRKLKLIERKYHFVRSKVEEGHVIVKDIRSEDNLADLFIKALAKSRHDEHARSIGLKDKIKF
ncbi:retrotransposon protein, putative, ty1-copia subclass [Tanacetum coccineum]